MKFSINGAPLAVENFAPDLGVIDTDLKFNKHINDLVARAKQRAALIRRCSISRDVNNNLMLAFKIYVRPLFEYSSQIWSPHLAYLNEKVESVQCFFTKCLPGLANLTYAERLTNLEMQSLEHRRLLCDLRMCFGIVHRNIALRFDDLFAFSNNAFTRGHPFELTVPLAKTDVRKYFFAVRIVPVWNSLPNNFVTASSIQAFKSLISAHDFSLCLVFLLKLFVPIAFLWYAMIFVILMCVFLFSFLFTCILMCGMILFFKSNSVWTI